MSLQGNVKWFDMKKGFGIIRVITPDSDKLNEEYFVHYSNIVTKENNYKRLCPGEYVSFDLDSFEDKKDVCVNVTGLFGGPLLSENTDFRYRISKNPHHNNNPSNENNEPEDDE